MRVVIDSNKLRSDELRWFLAQGSQHFAVLTDYAWMEAYKGDPVVAIIKSLEVLSRFPSQIVILKGTKAVGALDADSPGVARRMVVPNSDQEFQKTIEALKQLPTGDKGVRASIHKHGSAAKEHMNKISSDAADLTPALKDIESLFSSSELKAIRTAPAYPSDVIGKVLLAADHMYHNFRHAHPSKPRAASRKWRTNSFLYRFALAAVIYNITWIRHGSQINRKPDEIRKDLVDLNFAVFGTYFNGIMSDDKRLQEIHVELRMVLGALGARVPSPYDPLSYLIEGLLALKPDGRPHSPGGTATLG